MAAGRRPAPGSNQTRKLKAGGAEYRFVIDSYTPNTIPMQRLAEYMVELARLLGETSAVHFKKIEKGSVVLVQHIDREAVPKVRARTSGIESGSAPQEAIKAFKSLNKLLRDDNGVGQLKVKGTAVVLKFPGRLTAEEKFTSVRQHGSIDGRINRIGGKDESVHLTLESEGRQLSGCYTTRAIAKELRHHLFDPVRLFGRGRWSRDNEGVWHLEEFKIESFEPLKELPLSSALAELRELRTSWDSDAFDELSDLRKDNKGPNKNGGH